MRIAIVCITALLFIAVGRATAQPLSGDYSVGGASPDFASLQDVADALKKQGVSGPTFFNIRSGTYTENGGNNTVLELDSIVAGLSAANRITFQPDLSTGGNVDNVILELNRTNACTADRNLVLVQLDFVTLRNLTFRHVDSLNNVCGSVRLFRVEGVSTNLLIDDLILDGCRFIGTTFSNSGFTRGTDYGLSGNQTTSKVTITNNRFDSIRWAVFFEAAAGTVVVEDNEVYAGYGGGTAITVPAESASVKRNYVDFMGGLATAGIQVQPSSVAFVEQNIVMNSSGGTFYGIRSISSSLADSIIIANNIVSGNVGGTTTGIQITTENTRILNNTITNPATFIVTGLDLNAANCTVIDNIFINGAGSFLGVVLDLGNPQSPGFISDHNILYYAPGGGGAGNHIAYNGTFYTTLEEYQLATGLDTNSVFKEIEFVVDSLGLHLDECQSQDQDLIGIPLPEVRIDFFGAPRDSVHPFIGAVEGTPIPFDMFAAPFKISLPGTPFSIAAGRFDNLLADGLAIPDYDNMQIHLYHNNFSTRTFTPAGNLPTDFRPVVVRFFDLDEDGNLDLVVGGDASAVAVFWGDGIGGFTDASVVETLGRVRSLEPGPTLSTGRTVVLTEDNGFLPTSSWLGYLVHLGGRSLCHDVQRAGVGFPPDTVRSTMVDLVVRDLGGDGTLEVAALTLAPLPPSLVLVNDIVVLIGAPVPCNNFIFTGTVNELQLGTGNLTDASSIVAGDFDGDLDEDLITTGASENQCILIRNQGNFSFTVEPILTVATRAITALDYENDGDLDLVAANRSLDAEGLTVFLNDGSGDFTDKRNCFFPFASGEPSGMIAGDFDLDGKTDIAITTFLDSVFILYNFGGGITQVEGQPTAELPQSYSLSQNYPNPFNPTTAISYQLPAVSHVTLKIYNILGQEVVTLVDGVEDSGYKSVTWNAFNVSSGLYFYRLDARTVDGSGSFSSVRKMIVVK